MLIINTSQEPYSGYRRRGGRAFTVHPGRTVDVPDELAERLIRSGRFAAVKDTPEPGKATGPTREKAPKEKGPGGGTR